MGDTRIVTRTRRRGHGAARLAWSVWTLAVALSVLFVVLLVADRGSPGPLEYGDAPAITGIYIVLFLIFPTPGAFIAARQPGNAIGWMFCFTGIAIAGAACAQIYADYALFKEAGSLPGDVAAAWLQTWLFPAGLFVTPIMLLFLFPDGRPSSPRWRPVIAFAIAVLVLGFTAMMLRPGSLEPFGLANPIGLPGSLGRAAVAIEDLFAASAAPFGVLGVVSLVTRFRASSGVERQQLKWFAYAAGVFGVAVAISFAFAVARLPAYADYAFVVAIVALMCIPIACAAAILKYRLYDIDRIVNRTLVYGAVTAILVAAYYGAVVVLQFVLSDATADNGIAVAASTLAVAALFRPLRARVQRFIDRRFYRARYDAAQTLDAFSLRLRDEVDLEVLTDDLLAVVHRTMQPTHMSMWLRAGPGRVAPYS